MDETPDELLKLVAQRQRMLHDAWLSEVGHKRPGMKPGLPMAEATQKAQDLEKKIDALVCISHELGTLPKAFTYLYVRATLTEKLWEDMKEPDD